MRMYVSPRKSETSGGSAGGDGGGHYSQKRKVLSTQTLKKEH